MTADEFRVLFNKNRDMPVTLADGSRTLALGLNGDKAVLFKPGGQIELPLDWFTTDDLSDGIFQWKVSPKPNLGHSIGVNPPR